MKLNNKFFKELIKLLKSQKTINKIPKYFWSPCSKLIKLKSRKAYMEYILNIKGEQTLKVKY